MMSSVTMQNELMRSGLMQTEVWMFISAAFLVVIGCMIPAKWLPPLPNDKLLHFLAFATLSFLATRIAANKLELGFWLFGLLLAGCALEALQICIPGRNFCIKDIRANAAGICAVAIYAFFLN